ncbi:MAG TPA: hypothetical protein VFJ60_04235 [Gaiella sp.]|nr:hypothetical protein [Gaiella sp.]
MGESGGGLLRRVESGAQVVEVDAEGSEALARTLLADEVGDEEPEQRLALERRERGRRRGVRA